MGHLANGNLGMEGSGKRLLVNGGGDGVAYFPPFIFKKRKVSAVRDFPPGCGRFAPPLVPVKEQERLDEVKSADMAESAQCETASPLEVLSKVEASNHNETLSPVNVAVESTGKTFSRRKTSAIRDLPQAVAANSTNSMEPVPVDTSVKPVPSEKLVQVEVLNDNQPTNGVVVNVEVESIMNKFPPRRKTSAVRDFPPACGRGAAPVDLKQVRKPVVAGVQVKPGVSVKKEMEQQVYVRDKGKQVQAEKTNIKSPMKIDKGSGKSGVKLGTEPLKLSKDMSFKKSSFGKSTKEPNPISLGSWDDREIVQSLMAKRYCPWGQGKKTLKPASVIQSPEDRKKIVETPNSAQLEVDQGKKASKSAIGNQSDTIDIAGLESLDHREIVQSLMAASKCPWRHGRKTFKSPGGQVKKFLAR